MCEDGTAKLINDTESKRIYRWSIISLFVAPLILY